MTNNPDERLDRADLRQVIRDASNTHASRATLRRLARRRGMSIPALQRAALAYWARAMLARSLEKR